MLGKGKKLTKRVRDDFSESDSEESKCSMRRVSSLIAVNKRMTVGLPENNKSVLETCTSDIMDQEEIRNEFTVVSRRKKNNSIRMSTDKTSTGLSVNPPAVPTAPLAGQNVSTSPGPTYKPPPIVV